MASSATGSELYTIPGGLRVFFNDGSGDRDLGNIVGDSVSMTRDTEELEHFSNRSGTRLKDKVVTIEEAAQIDFALDEINIQNLQYFFKGGSTTNVAAGTASITDQKETLVGEQFISVEKLAITSVTARQFVDYVRIDENGAGTFTNNDAEADTAAGSAFTLLDSTTDVLYVGKLTQFKEVDIQLDTNGSYGGNVSWEYWNGSAWTALTTAGVDTLEADGVMTFTPPGDWALITVDSNSAYWIRASSSTVTTPATALSIGRQALVENTDYRVDPGSDGSVTPQQDGRISRIDSGGALVDGEEMKVSFTHVTFASQTFGIAQVSTIEGSARFVNKPSTGRGVHWEIIVPRAQLTNNGNMDLNDSEFQQIPLSLVFLDNSACDPVNPFGTIQVFE